MNRHREIASMMRAPAATSDWVHLWRVIDSNVEDPPPTGDGFLIDSMGAYNAPLDRQAYGNMVERDGDTCFQAVGCNVELVYDDLGLELREGGDDYSLIVAVQEDSFGSSTPAIYSNTNGLNVKFWPNSTSNDARLTGNNGVDRSVYGCRSGDHRRSLIAYTREGSLGKFMGVYDGGSEEYSSDEISSPTPDQTTLGIGSSIVSVYWAGLQAKVITFSELQQMFIDWRPPPQ